MVRAGAERRSCGSSSIYESDPIMLGICGDKAKLLQKHGISEISDELLENSVTIRVNVGLGAGDPQQRLAKFQSAVQVAHADVAAGSPTSRAAKGGRWTTRR
jgi:hypothetical protein